MYHADVVSLSHAIQNSEIDFQRQLHAVSKGILECLKGALGQWHHDKASLSLAGFKFVEIMVEDRDNVGRTPIRQFGM